MNNLAETFWLCGGPYGGMRVPITTDPDGIAYVRLNESTPPGEWARYQLEACNGNVYNLRLCRFVGMGKGGPGDWQHGGDGVAQQ